MTTILAIIIPIVALILIVGVWRDLTKPKKIAPKDQAAINAVRYQNYGHSFDIPAYLEKFKNSNKIPDTIMSYTIRKSKNGLWCIFLYLSNIYDSEKKIHESVILEYPYEREYPFSYYYDNNKNIGATYSYSGRTPEKFLKDEIDNSVQSLSQKYTKAYPFNFAEEERDGVL